MNNDLSTFGAGKGSFFNPFFEVTLNVGSATKYRHCKREIGFIFCHFFEVLEFGGGDSWLFDPDANIGTFGGGWVSFFSLFFDGALNI